MNPNGLDCRICSLQKLLIDLGRPWIILILLLRTRPAGCVGPQNGDAAHVNRGRPPKPNAKTSATPIMGKTPCGGRALGPPSHVKPCSQSYGVGLTASVMAGGWLAAGAASEAGVGEGGAKRGEYEVRIRGAGVPSSVFPLLFAKALSFYTFALRGSAFFLYFCCARQRF